MMASQLVAKLQNQISMYGDYAVRTADNGYEVEEVWVTTGERWSIVLGYGAE